MYYTFYTNLLVSTVFIVFFEALIIGTRMIAAQIVTQPFKERAWWVKVLAAYVGGLYGRIALGGFAVALSRHFAALPGTKAIGWYYLLPFASYIVVGFALAVKQLMTFHVPEGRAVLPHFFGSLVPIPFIAVPPS